MSDAAQPLHSFAAILTWLAQQQQQQTQTVTQIPLVELDQWQMSGDPLRLAHRSGRFFTIEGLHVETDAGPTPVWDQPIIHQPEIGVLGIITSVFDDVRHYLMQAKIEPDRPSSRSRPTVPRWSSASSRSIRKSTTRRISS